MRVARKNPDGTLDQYVRFLWVWLNRKKFFSEVRVLNNLTVR